MTAEITRADAAPESSSKTHRSRERRPSHLLWWGIGLVATASAVGAILALSSGMPFFQSLDDVWRRAVGESPDSGLHETIVPLFLEQLGALWGGLIFLVMLPIGGVIALVSGDRTLFTAIASGLPAHWGALLIVAIMFAVPVFIGRWRSMLFLLSSIVMAGVLPQILKNVADRPRPTEDLTAGLFGPLGQIDHGSFPSGHAAMAGAIAVMIVALMSSAPRLAGRIGTIIAVMLVLGMMWQRTLVNAHWLSDTFFGSLLGIGGGLIVWWLFWPLVQRDNIRPIRLLRSPAP